MYVAILQVELSIPDADTLKGRRRVVRSLVDRLRQRFGAAVSEVGVADEHHVANIGIALVSSDAKLIRKLAQRVREFLENLRDAEVTDLQVEFL